MRRGRRRDFGGLMERGFPRAFAQGKMARATRPPNTYAGAVVRALGTHAYLEVPCASGFKVHQGQRQGQRSRARRLRVHGRPRLDFWAV